jgi:hypothetical protein
MKDIEIERRLDDEPAAQAELAAMTPNQQKRYGLEVVRPFHREVARRLALGQKPSAVAGALGVTPSRIQQLMNSPLFKIELKKLMDERDQSVVDVRNSLKEISPVALEILERTMYTAKSERLRKEAAESVLDRAGFGAINKSAVAIQADVRHSGSYARMSDAELRQLINDRMKRLEDNEQARVTAEEKVKELEFHCEVDEGSGSEQSSEGEMLVELTKRFMGIS